MKVLHVESGRHLYGGARQVLYLLQGLQREGVDNLLACPQDSEIQRAAQPHATVCALHMTGDLDLALVGRLRALIRRHRPDIVHLHSRRGADLLGGLAARLERVPTVLSRRVDNPEPRWWVAVKYRLYDRIVTISEGIRQVLLAEGVAPGKVVCVHSAVVPEEYQSPCNPEDFRRAFGLAGDGPLIGVIAQLIPRKGHRHLLAVLPELVEEFGKMINVSVIGHIPRAADVQKAESMGGTVVEKLPDSPQAKYFRDVADVILSKTPEDATIPTPIELADIMDLLRKYQALD